MVMVYLDLTGSVTSLGQMFFDSKTKFNSYDIFANSFNSTKFLLSLISLSADLTFIVQNFLYSENSPLYLSKIGFIASFE